MIRRLRVIVLIKIHDPLPSFECESIFKPGTHTSSGGRVQILSPCIQEWFVPVLPQRGPRSLTLVALHWEKGNIQTFSRTVEHRSEFPWELGVWELGDKWGPNPCPAHSDFPRSVDTLSDHFPVPEYGTGTDIFGHWHNPHTGFLVCGGEMWLWEDQMAGPKMTSFHPAHQDRKLKILHSGG